MTRYYVGCLPVEKVVVPVPFFFFFWRVVPPNTIIVIIIIMLLLLLSSRHTRSAYVHVCIKNTTRKQTARKLVGCEITGKQKGRGAREKPTSGNRVWRKIDNEKNNNNKTDEKKSTTTTEHRQDRRERRLRTATVKRDRVRDYDWRRRCVCARVCSGGGGGSAVARERARRTDLSVCACVRTIIIQRCVCVYE